MNGYDFILVVERMDESLVALALLLGVPVGDMLVSSSKVSGVTTDEGNDNIKAKKTSYVYSQRYNRCLPMVKTFTPPKLQRYLDSDHFRAQSYGDLILHQAANYSLDMTIDRLGKGRFNAALKEFQYWKQREENECARKVQFPCSSDGTPQWDVSEKNCYLNDMGCGHQCIDDMLESDEEPA